MKSRRIVGFAFGDHQDAELGNDMLMMAGAVPGGANAVIGDTPLSVTQPMGRA